VIDYDRVDYFTDQSLVHDPHPYFDHLRNRCPIAREPHYGVYAVTGYEEAAAILKDTDTFSACVSVGGPFPPLPFECSGDDISGLIELNRSKLPMYEHMVTMDPPQHTDARSLLSRLLTPSRLKENEQFMWALADRQLDEFLANGHCEFLAEYAKPFSLLVIADLLGVPEEDHDSFAMRDTRWAVLGRQRRTRHLTTRRDPTTGSTPGPPSRTMSAPLWPLPSSIKTAGRASSHCVGSN
jgi:cytochrome P450